MSTFWRALFDLTGTKLGTSTAYHPQTDGQSERTNRTLEDMLRAYTNERQTDWDLHLTTAEFAVNNAAQASTGQTPFFLNYGEHPRTPAALISGPSTSTNQATTDFVTAIREALASAKTHLRRAQQRQSSVADRHRRDVHFNVGDRVLLSTAHLNLRDTGPARKLQPKFIGPFPVQAKIGEVAYRLDLPATMKCHPVFHVSLLRPHRTSTAFPDRDDDSRPPPVLESADGDHYLVERILESRTIGRGTSQRREYLVKWLGYPYYDATWEPEANVRRLDAFKDFVASRTTPS